MRTTPEVEEVMVPCAASAQRLTLDLSGLTFMDSTGLGLVLSAQQLCRASGAEFALVPGPTQVQSVFEVTGLLDRLPFETS
jgi:anti-sigma B factor antagonist